MFALGHFEPAAGIDVDHPEIHATLTAAHQFREDSKAFVNLSLYEQRLQRTLKESLRQLHELQASRRADVTASRRAPDRRIAPEVPHHPIAKEFVFSPSPTPAQPAPQPAQLCPDFDPRGDRLSPASN